MFIHHDTHDVEIDHHVYQCKVCNSIFEAPDIGHIKLNALEIKFCPVCRGKLSILADE